jgi:hypothetical protein
VVVREISRPYANNIAICDPQVHTALHATERAVSWNKCLGKRSASGQPAGRDPMDWKSSLKSHASKKSLLTLITIACPYIGSRPCRACTWTVVLQPTALATELEIHSELAERVFRIADKRHQHHPGGYGCADVRSGNANGGARALPILIPWRQFSDGSSRVCRSPRIATAPTPVRPAWRRSRGCPACQRALGLASSCRGVRGPRW